MVKYLAAVLFVLFIPRVTWAQLCLPIPDASRKRVIDTSAARFGYEDAVLNAAGELVPNPDTKEEFVIRELVRLLREHVLSFEVKDEQAAVAERLRKELDTDFPLPTVKTPSPSAAVVPQRSTK